MSDKHDAASVPDTGHVWDGDLRDLTNQPPKWWMLGLTASAQVEEELVREVGHEPGIVHGAFDGCEA